MNIWDKLKSIYAPPSEEVLAAHEYDQARRSLLDAHSAREYADAMVTYHQRRIDRLRTTLSRDQS